MHLKTSDTSLDGLCQLTDQSNCPIFDVSTGFKMAVNAEANSV